MQDPRSADYWFQQGRKAGQAGDPWQPQLQSADAHVTAESDARITGLERESSGLQALEQACAAGLGIRSTRPAAESGLGLLAGIIRLGLGVALLCAGYQLTLASLPLLGRFDDAKSVLAGVLAVGTAAAFEICTGKVARVLPRESFRKLLMWLSVVPVLCLLAASLSMALLRADAVAVQQAVALQDNPGVIIEGAVQHTEAGYVQAAVADFYTRSRRLTTLLMFLATAGLEIVAALALHDAGVRLRSAIVVLAEQRRLAKLRREIATCAQAIDQWQQYPRVVREAFTRGALFESGRRMQRRVIAAAVCAVVVLAIILMFVSRARAQEVVIAAIDLSTSSAGDELQSNVRGIEQLIAQLRPGSRLLVIPISEQSFAAPLILDARLSADTGLFDERLKAGRHQLATAWRERAKALHANGTATDIFGMLMRVAVVREEQASSRICLVVFSDARQHSRGYRFEGPTRLDPSVLARVEREGLIPPLPGVQVWVLGAHASGISDTHWLSLKTLWKAYFSRAGATLKAFSPERRWTRE